MLDDNGRLVLMDFGMHTFSDQAPTRAGGVAPIPDSWRYKPAEELRLFSEHGIVAFRSRTMDVYAFAATVYAVRSSLNFTGQPSTHRCPWTVFQMYTGGPPVQAPWIQWIQLVHGGRTRLQLQQHPWMSDVLWGILQRCLNPDPARRPRMVDVVRDLEWA